MSNIITLSAPVTATGTATVAKVEDAGSAAGNFFLGPYRSMSVTPDRYIPANVVRTRVLGAATQGALVMGVLDAWKGRPLLASFLPFGPN